MQLPKILITDDDLELCELLKEFLVQDGYSVETVNNGDEAISACKNNDYDLMILDVMMPIKNGFDTLRELRTSSQIPVIMLTAKGEKIDRIVGLEMGADDYVAKPCDPRELSARIKAVLRRTALTNQQITQHVVQNNNQNTIRVNDLIIKLDSREVFIGSNLIDLTSTEFDFLVLLAKYKGKLVTRESLSKEVLGKRLQAYDRSIDMHISHIRKKLGLYSDGSERIKTRRGNGYQYIVKDGNSIN